MLCPSLVTSLPKVGGEGKGRGGEGVVVVRDMTTKERKCDMVEVGWLRLRLRH